MAAPLPAPMIARYEFALKPRRHLAEPTASRLGPAHLLNGVRIARDADHGELVSIERLPTLSGPSPSPLIAEPDRLAAPRCAS